MIDTFDTTAEGAWKSVRESLSGDADFTDRLFAVSGEIADEYHLPRDYVKSMFKVHRKLGKDFDLDLFSWKDTERMYNTVTLVNQRP